MAGGESRARGRGIERRRMQKRTSGGKIREEVTGESLSSYYEEQKGGKKVEIGGKKEWIPRGEKVRPSLSHGGMKKALEKGKGAGVFFSLPFGRKGNGRNRKGG